MASDGIAIVGATATGKTALSIEVARRVGGEVVSVDSRQVYRGMDIGTAKATPAQRAAVPHHAIDVAEATERFSAGRFARLARGWIDEIHARGRVPMLVGGTGFFLRALTHPLFREPELDPERRRALEARLMELETGTLRAWLRALDAATAASLERGGGRQRLLRALEVALLTGRPLSWWHAQRPAAEAPMRFLTFVLELPREELYARIEARVERMIEEGLVAEVRALLDAGVPAGAPALTATGYAEIIPVLERRATLEEARRQIVQATRRYARRQLTWFRHQLPGDVVRLDARRAPAALAAEVARAWREEEAA